MIEEALELARNGNNKSIVGQRLNELSSLAFDSVAWAILGAALTATPTSRVEHAASKRQADPAEVRSSAHRVHYVFERAPEPAIWDSPHGRCVRREVFAEEVDDRGNLIGLNRPSSR